MDVLNNAVELLGSSVSRNDLENMSYKKLLITLEHRSRFIRNNKEYMENKKVEEEMRQLT